MRNDHLLIALLEPIPGVAEAGVAAVERVLQSLPDALTRARCARTFSGSDERA